MNMRIAVGLACAMALCGCGGTPGTPQGNLKAASGDPVQVATPPPDPVRIADAAAPVARKMTAGAFSSEVVDKAMREFFSGKSTQTLEILAAAPPGEAALPPSTDGEVIKDWDGLFSVTLPPGHPLPERSVKVLPHASGQTLEYYTYQSENADGDSAQVSFAVYAEDMFGGDQLEQQLDAIRDGALQNPGARLISEQKTDEFSLPGRILRVAVDSDTGSIHGVFLYVVKARYMYQLIYMSYSPDKVESEAVNRFIHSLKWLPAFR